MQHRLELDIERPHIFPEGILSGITRRNLQHFDGCGFSVAPGETLGLEQATRHRAILAEFLGVPCRCLRFQRQVHGTHIVEVTGETEPVHADGMISREAGLVLCAVVADCAAVMLYESVTHSIAVVHSGWRGARDNISGKAVAALDKYGGRPKNMSAYISPCASGLNYEVGEEVADCFPPHVKTRRGEKWMLDMRRHIADQLVDAGVKQENIEIAADCTIADTRYHSYRRDGRLSGRMAAFIVIAQ